MDEFEIECESCDWQGYWLDLLLIEDENSECFGKHAKCPGCGEIDTYSDIEPD